MHRTSLPALALLAMSARVQATELYSWHSFDNPFRVTEKVEGVIHARVRSRGEFHTLQQVRGGVIMRWKATSRLIPFSGYYFQPAHEPGQRWDEGHRLFAGAEIPVGLPGSAMLTTRLAAERHMSAGRPNYNRYRSYARLTWGKGRVGPYLQNEWLGVRQGFHSVRNSGGLRIRISPQAILEVGYLYDIRRTFWGGDRQAIVTSIRFERAEK